MKVFLSEVISMVGHCCLLRDETNHHMGKIQVQSACLFQLIIVADRAIKKCIYRKFENELRGLYFSKAFFEGLIFGEAYIRKKNCISKSARLTLGGKFASQNRLGQLIVGMKFKSATCRKVLLKLALRT